MIFDDLREIQSQYGYLPPEQLQALSQRTKTPLYRIHGVADFYPHFHLSRPPKVTMSVCSDMSCHLRGSGELKATLRQRFQGMSEKDIAIRDGAQTSKLTIPFSSAASGAEIRQAKDFANAIGRRGRGRHREHERKHVPCTKIDVALREREESVARGLDLVAA